MNYFARKDAQDAEEARIVSALKDNLDIERQEGVFVWRRNRFLKMGFPWDWAVRMAKDGDIDLHDTEKMIARGCPHHVAIEILS